MRGGEAGSTLIEVLAAIAILTVIAAALAPNVTSMADSARIAAGARVLEDVAKAIRDPDPNASSFEVHHARYPGKIEHLTRKIVTGEQNSCGNNYLAGQLIPDKWRGPYVNRLITDAGIPIGIGTLQNDLIRDDPANVEASRLRIRVVGVTPEDAAALDSRYDLGDGSASGTIQWEAADAEGLVTLSYVLTVFGC